MGYYWIVFIVGTVAGIFCVFLLLLWAYTNAKKLWTCIRPDRNDQQENVGNINIERSHATNSCSVTNVELPEIPFSENSGMSYSSNPSQNTNLESLPPKYEDIQSHLIVEPYPLSTSVLEDGNPPKYEDIIHQ